MSWDRKAERRSIFLKRKKATNNTRSKKFRKHRKEELKYKEDLNDLYDSA